MSSDPANPLDEMPHMGGIHQLYDVELFNSVKPLQAAIVQQKIFQIEGDTHNRYIGGVVCRFVDADPAVANEKARKVMQSWNARAAKLRALVEESKLKTLEG